MAEYGLMDVARPGLTDGLQRNVRTLAVQEGDGFEFGDPIFVAVGDEVNAYVGDNANADLLFAGVAIISHRSSVVEQGEYEEYDAMNCLEAGDVWVRVPSDVSDLAHSRAYVIDDPTDEHYGYFTNVEGTNFLTGGYFRTGPVVVGDDSLAILRVAGVREEESAT
jgi:hypothetical protein